MSELVRLRSSGMEWRDVEGEIVALDVVASTFLSVNRAGAVLWDLLAAGATPDQLARRLVDEFGIDPEAAVRDVGAFVVSLRSLNLLDAG